MRKSLILVYTQTKVGLFLVHPDHNNFQTLIILGDLGSKIRFDFGVDSNLLHRYVVILFLLPKDVGQIATISTDFDL